MKRVIQLVVGVAISLLMLWLAFRNVSMDETMDAVGRVAWWVYPAYFIQLCIQYVFRTWRWQRQTVNLTGKPFPFMKAFAICTVSFAGTFLLPFRLGEFIRPYLARQQGYGRKSIGLATVALERVVDGVVMTGLLALLLTQLGSRRVDPVISTGGFLALLVFGGALVVFVAAYRWKEASIRFWGAVLKPMGPRISEKLLGILEAFIEGLKSLPNLKEVGIYLLMTAVYWGFNGLGMWMLARGMDLDVPLLGGFFSLCCLVVGITIPAGPGNVGNFEYAIQISLKAFGVSASDGAGYAIWTHLFQTVHMVALAGLFLGLGKIHLTRKDIEDANSGTDMPSQELQPPA